MALATALSACSLAPPHQAPPLPVTARYPADTGLPGETVSADDADGRRAAATAWPDYFADPVLQRCIALALEHSRDLRAAVLRVEEARARYGLEGAALFPTIGPSADMTRARTPADLSVTRQAMVGSQYQVGIGMTVWELDFWGRLRNAREAALQNLLASDAARQAATVSLIAQVAEAYLGLRELDERIALARRTVATREQSFRIFKRRTEVGSTSRLDLAQVETLLRQAQALGAQLEQARAEQAHALTLLVGAPVDVLPGSQALDDRMVMRELRAGLPSSLLTQRPDIIAAEYRLRGAHANIGAARAAFFPQITLTGGVGTASAELGGLFESGSRAWTFAPSLFVPLFDGGRNRAALDLAQVRRDQAVADYEKTVQTAFREVSDALSAQRWLAEQIGIAQASLATQTERARLAQLRYDNGAAPYFEVLDAQRDLLSAEQQLVQTRRALLASRVRLYAALGGGSQQLNAPPLGRRDVADPSSGDPSVRKDLR